MGLASIKGSSLLSNPGAMPPVSVNRPAFLGRGNVKQGNIILFNGSSLKTRITLITLAVFLLGSWSLSLYVSRLLQADMERVLSDQQLSMATLLAKEMDREISDRLDALQQTSVSSRKAMQFGPAAMQAFIEMHPVLQSMFNGGLLVYNRDGLLIANVPRNDERVGTYVRDAEVIAEAVEMGRATVGKAFLGEHANAPTVGIAAPIYTEEGLLLGAIVGEIDRKSTRLNSSHRLTSRMPSSA
jgi:sensor histidine kinase regulating citrate/malate metabolism